MKRKRFVKLLMARGLDRNMAQFSTALVGGKFGSSYAEVFAHMEEYRKVKNIPATTAIAHMFCPPLADFSFDAFYQVGALIMEGFAQGMAAMSEVFAWISRAAANASAAFANMRVAATPEISTPLLLDEIGGNTDEEKTLY